MQYTVHGETRTFELRRALGVVQDKSSLTREEAVSIRPLPTEFKALLDRN